jgi:DNA-binding transcriptional LysR family regulator
MLDVRRLHVLCEVARHGSFSAAAASLGYTQPAVSRQVATLEAETGMILVRRVPQGAVLTDAGRLLVDRAEAILARLNGAELELQGLAGLEGGRLRVTSFASAAASVVPIAIARFRERFPRVELSVEIADPEDSIPGLRVGDLDMALTHDTMDAPVDAQGRLRLDATDEAGGIELVHLFDDPMHVALPVGHALVRAPVVALKSFASEPWMLATPDTCPDSRRFLRACHEAGFEPRIAFQNNDYSAILGFVAAGVGVALVPDMVTRGVRDDVVIRVLDPPPPPRPILVALPLGYRSPPAEAMLGVLEEVCREWVAAQPSLAAA